jgi:predicted small lipoprotein YifL
MLNRSSSVAATARAKPAAAYGLAVVRVASVAVVAAGSAVALTLGGCGQKGPLLLAEPAARAASGASSATSPVLYPLPTTSTTR